MSTEKTEQDVLEKLEYTKGVLHLLRETGLFGPIIDKAIEDVESAILLISA